MKITNGKITINDFVKNDIKKKISIINNKNNNTFLHYDLPLEYCKTLKWYENKKLSNRIDCTIRYNNEVCGFIGLINIDYINKKAEYYICIDYNYSGKNIGVISSLMLLDYAFSKLKINKVYLFTEIDNSKAQYIFEKIGFHREGLLKDDIFYNGKMISRYVYGIWKKDINL